MKFAAFALTALLLLSFEPPLIEAASKPPESESSAGAIGPFVVSSGNGRWSLALGLAAQLQYQQDIGDLSESELRTASSFVEARRIRPMISGSLISRDLIYFLHLSTAPGSLEFMDLYLDYTFLPGMSARLGQWKIPFTRFRIGSFKNLTFVDWPITTSYFGAERQMGLAFHNGYERPPRLEFEAGVFSGVNARAAHAIGLSRLYGEQVENPSDLVNPGPRAGVHPELVAHLAYNHGDIDTRFDTDFKGGGLRWSAGMSGALDLDPDRTQDLTLRLAPEILAKLRHVSFSSVLYLGFAPYGSQYHAARIAMLGALLQSSYLVRRNLELSVRYAVVHLFSKLVLKAQQQARRLYYRAQDEQERDQRVLQIGRAGRLQREQEFTVGLNLYLLGRSLKLRSDMGWLHRSLVTRDRLDMRFRCQVQLVF